MALRQATKLGKALILCATATLFCTCLCSGQVPGSPFVDGGLYLKNLQLPTGARITHLRIELKAGSFVSVGNIPRAWKVNVDNKQNGGAVLSLCAQNEEAAVSERALKNTAIWIHEAVRELGELPVSGEYLFSTESERKGKRVPLSHFNFDFVQGYARRRLD